MEVPSQPPSRARSPSTGGNNNNTNASSSHLNPTHPIQYPDTIASLNPDPTISSSTTYTSPDPNIPSSNNQFLFTTPYLSATSQDTQSFEAHVSAPDQPFDQSQQYAQSFDTGLLSGIDQSSGVKETEEGQFSGLLNSEPSSGFDPFPSFTQTDLAADFAPSGVMASKQDPMAQHHMGHNINSVDFNRIASPPGGGPASPHLIPPDSHSSPGRPASPISSPGTTYYTPQHSRHASLDPASAAYISSAQSDWQGVLGSMSFQRHRAPSESDVSSVSHSPFLPQHESFDTSDNNNNNHSPLLHAQNDPSLYDNAFGMEGFSLADQVQQHPGYSPAHSPYISPRLSPQQPNLELDPEINLLQAQQLGGHTSSVAQEPYMVRPDGSTSPLPSFPTLNNNLGDMGQAAQMTPPSINVEFAPPSRTSTLDAPKIDADGDTLSPPMSRSRGRSKSDPFGHPMTRPTQPSSLNAVALSSGPTSDPRSLSPFSRSSGNLSTPSSRDTSPAAKNRRQSTSSIDNRSYILGLADPQRPGSSTTESKRVQKHPATFQCTLCPKKFTRAYNLRSHLRTHTDERPFVCTVCGKAFARQHDRKRHESLHSGEKKFVCRGDLTSGRQWGCGRRFARADALGRHFRSEAGRVCIKPLLDEEAIERDNTYKGQQQHQQLPPHQQHLDQASGHLQPVHQPLNVPGMDGRTAGFTLPAALLAQYPALQTIQWDQIAPQTDDNSDIGGRSSFDASSGGEFGFGDDDGYLSGAGSSHSPGPSDQAQHQQQQQQQHLLGVGVEPVNTGGGGGAWGHVGQGWTDYSGAR